jgi:hypothetical protein
MRAMAAGSNDEDKTLHLEPSATKNFTKAFFDQYTQRRLIDEMEKANRSLKVIADSLEFLVVTIQEETEKKHDD